MIAVIGAGVSGLAAAWRATAAKRAVVVLESDPGRVGGSIFTQRLGDAVYDCGANSTLLKHDSVRDLLRETGLDGLLVKPATAAKTRWILRGGRLVPLPGGPLGLLGTPLFRARDKLRLLGEPFRAPAPESDESVAAFVRRRLGPSFLDNAVGPFIGSGIFAGDPERLSIKHAMPALWKMEREHGSLLKGALREGRNGPRPSLISFRGGMRVLPERLAGALPDGTLRLGHRVERVTRAAAGFRVEGTSEAGPFSIEAQRVLVAVPGRFVPAMLEPLGPEAARFAEIPYASVVNVFSVYRRDQFARRPEGFGFLRARGEEGTRMLGCIFTGSLWPDRLPAEEIGFTSFFGGRLDPDAAALAPPEIEALAHRELAGLLGIRGEPLRQGSHAWRPAIPQLEVGHDRFLEAAAALEARNPGLRLLGNYLRGVSVADCLDRGLSVEF